ALRRAARERPAAQRARAFRRGDVPASPPSGRRGRARMVVAPARREVARQLAVRRLHPGHAPRPRGIPGARRRNAPCPDRHGRLELAAPLEPQGRPGRPVGRELARKSGGFGGDPHGVRRDHAQVLTPGNRPPKTTAWCTFGKSPPPEIRCAGRARNPLRVPPTGVPMKSRMLPALALGTAALVAVPSLQGCYGSFAATKKVYKWNGTVGDKWVNTVV